MLLKYYVCAGSLLLHFSYGIAPGGKGSHVCGLEMGSYEAALADGWEMQTLLEPPEGLPTSQGTESDGQPAYESMFMFASMGGSIHLRPKLQSATCAHFR